MPERDQEIALRALGRAAESAEDAAQVIMGAGYLGTVADLIREARHHLDTAEKHLAGEDRDHG